MSWLDIHKRRHANEGETLRDAYTSNAASFINHAFADSPTYTVVTIEDKEYEARLITEKKFTVASGYEVMKLLFRPNTEISNGKIVEIKDEKWLIVHTNTRQTSPKADIRFCNNVLEFDNGQSYPCVVDGNIRDTQKINEEYYVDLPSDKVSVLVPFNEDTRKIVEKDRFVINGIAWEVQGFDRITQVYNHEGIIELALKKVPLKESEKPTEPEKPPVPLDDYHVEILGSDEVMIGSTTAYTSVVYLNGEVISTNTKWAASNGTIDEYGEFTAPSEPDYVGITAEYEYIDSDSNIQKIVGVLDVEVYEDDWGWGW